VNAVPPGAHSPATKDRSRSPVSLDIPGGPEIFRQIFTRLGFSARPPEFRVVFYPYAGLTNTIRLRQDVAFVRLSDLLRDAPLDVVEAAAAILLSRLYRRFSRSRAMVTAASGRRADPLTEMLRTYQAFASQPGLRRRMHAMRRRRVRHTPLHPQGAHHDLSQIYARLNQEYFSSELKLPRLGWSGRSWLRQLGCYDPAIDQILLNRRLDAHNVPEFAVAYVLYHEMLHQKHPPRLARCRFETHSADFRRKERLFPQYAEAMRFLKRLQ
jgi:hypothetical protein